MITALGMLVVCEHIRGKGTPRVPSIPSIGSCTKAIFLLSLKLSSIRFEKEIMDLCVLS